MRSLLFTLLAVGCLNTSLEAALLAQPTLTVSGYCSTQVRDVVNVSTGNTCGNPGVLSSTDMEAASINGKLQVYTTATLDNSAILNNRTFYGSSFASYDNSFLKVTGASGIGSVVLQLLVHGTGTAGANLDFLAMMNSTGDSDSANVRYGVYGTGSPFSVNQTHTLRIDNFDFSERFSLYIQLDGVVLFDPGDQGQTRTLDAYHTSSITGFGIYDEFGAPIPGAFVGDDVTTFSSLTATPEPSAVFLVCGGLLTVVGLRRRSSR